MLAVLNNIDLQVLRSLEYIRGGCDFKVALTYFSPGKFDALPFKKSPVVSGRHRKDRPPEGHLIIFLSYAEILCDKRCDYTLIGSRKGSGEVVKTAYISRGH